jgi:hypothetical protein
VFGACPRSKIKSIVFLVFYLLLSVLAHARARQRRRQRSISPCFLFERNLTACPKISQTGSHLGRDDPKRCNQIKIMPFIQTSLRPKCKTEGYHAYNMSPFLVACLLKRWQRASSARCLQNKARGLTRPRSSKPLCPDSADVRG